MSQEVCYCGAEMMVTEGKHRTCKELYDLGHELARATIKLLKEVAVLRKEVAMLRGGGEGLRGYYACREKTSLSPS